MRRQQDLDAIVFDVGNVLVTYQPHAYLRAMHDEPLASRIYEAIFGSPHWMEMDRSVLT